LTSKNHIKENAGSFNDEPGADQTICMNGAEGRSRKLRTSHSAEIVGVLLRLIACNRKQRETTSAMLAVPAIDTSKSVDSPKSKTLVAYDCCRKLSSAHFHSVRPSILDNAFLSNL
jgi:hypothetical protein